MQSMLRVEMPSIWLGRPVASAPTAAGCDKRHCYPRPLINKPPPPNRDYIRDPNIKALKRKGFINHGFTVPILSDLDRNLEGVPNFPRRFGARRQRNARWWFDSGGFLSLKSLWRPWVQALQGFRV